MNESMTKRTGPEVVGFVDDGIGHSSYLVNLGDGTALVVDPRRLPDIERAGAEARGLTIAFTADTHSHADFISGSPELAAEDVTFLAPAAGRLEVPHPGLPDEGLFVQTLLEGFGSFPSYFRRLPEINRRGPHVYGTAPALPELDLTTFRRLIDQGAQLVDVRPIAGFAAAHIPGSLSIELR